MYEGFPTTEERERELNTFLVVPPMSNRIASDVLNYLNITI